MTYLFVHIIRAKFAAKYPIQFPLAECNRTIHQEIKVNYWHQFTVSSKAREANKTSVLIAYKSWEPSKYIMFNEPIYNDGIKSITKDIAIRQGGKQGCTSKVGKQRNSRCTLRVPSCSLAITGGRNYVQVYHTIGSTIANAF